MTRRAVVSLVVVGVGLLAVLWVAFSFVAGEPSHRPALVVAVLDRQALVIAVPSCTVTLKDVRVRMSSGAEVNDTDPLVWVASPGAPTRVLSTATAGSGTSVAWSGLPADGRDRYLTIAATVVGQNGTPSTETAAVSVRRLRAGLMDDRGHYVPAERFAAAVPNCPG